MALISAKIISNVNIELKLFVLIFLLIKSKLFIPEYSILIKFSPIKPIISGRKILKISGKKAVMFIFINEFKVTSKLLIENRKRPN